MRRRVRGAIATAGLLLALLSLGTTAFAAGPADLDTLRARGLALVNKARADARLPPLALDERTAAAAQTHADDMLARRYYAHVTPEGASHQDRYMKAGGERWRVAGENIARCSACSPMTGVLVDRLQRDWMGSAAHRQNILMRGFDRFGLGLAAGRGGEVYAVQVFSGPGSPRGLEADEIADAAPPALQAALASARINRARKTSGRPDVAISPALSDAGRSALPDPRLAGFDLGKPLEITEALLPEIRRGWRTVQLIAAWCGGCGVLPTATDIRNFVDQWLGDPALEAVLTGPEPTHLGFSMAADGTGRKIAVAVFATAR